MADLDATSTGRTWHPATGHSNKHAGDAFRTVEERPAHEVFGPQGEQVAALIERLQRLTPEEALAMAAAWSAARDAARDAAWEAAWSAAVAAARDAAWFAAWDAAWNATWNATGHAAWSAAVAAAGLLVRDVLDPEHYRTLTGPAASVLGPLHPDDDSGREEH